MDFCPTVSVCFQVLFNKSVSYRIACHEHHARLLQRTVILHVYLLVEERVQRLPPHQLGHTHLDMIEKGFTLYLVVAGSDKTAEA